MAFAPDLTTLHPLRLITPALLTACLAGCTTPPASTYDHGALVRGDRSSKRIALVFTGGEHGEGTRPILDDLRERNIKGAFFLTGDYLACPAHRPLVRRMLAEGHYVGPHSHAHLLYCPWDDRQRSLVSEAEFKADLRQNIRDLRALGALPPGQRVYFIPPYEWYNQQHVRWAHDMDVTLVNFTPGSGSNRDWIPEAHDGWVPSAQIRRDILAFEAAEPHGLNGFILLLHLGSQRTDKMHPELRPLLVALRQRGYEFVRLDRAGWQ